MRVLLLLALMTGCDKLFQLEHVDDGSLTDALRGDGARDTRMNDAPPDTITQTHSNCPANFGVPYENSKYRYLATAMSWYDAMRFCANLDDPTSTKRVHLPVLSSDFERSNHVYVMVVGSASGYWIGLSDTKTIGAYQWVTAEPVSYPALSSWGTGEPSENPGDACVRVILSSNDLDSTLCMTQMPFVCECDDYALAPSQYTLM